MNIFKKKETKVQLILERNYYSITVNGRYLNGSITTNINEANIFYENAIANKGESCSKIIKEQVIN